MTHSFDFTIDLARQTGELLMKYYRPEGIPAKLKADRSLLTEADLAADKLIAEKIKETFPDDQILSEEADTYYRGADHPTWVIDPLDGTANFAAGIAIWGVSIARVVNGQPEVAALSFPALNELYSAQRGQGAWLNGRQIHTRVPNKEQPAAFFTCCTRTHSQFDVNVPYKIRILGSAAYTYCTVARGAVPLGFQATPRIWDLAAGWLLAEEAGSTVGTIDSPLPFPMVDGHDYDGLPYPSYIAASPQIAEIAQKNIKPRA